MLKLLETLNLVRRQNPHIFTNVFLDSGKYTLFQHLTQSDLPLMQAPITTSFMDITCSEEEMKDYLIGLISDIEKGYC